MRHFKFVDILLLVFAFGTFTYAEEPQPSAWLRSDLYELGSMALEDGNYLLALEKLYAFREFNKDQLKPSDFRTKLDGAIMDCEDILRGKSGVTEVNGITR
jgi:hypothetical protein